MPPSHGFDSPAAFPHGLLNAVAPRRLVLDYRRREAELIFRRIGITFAVYGEADAQERLIPFDVIPRIISAALSIAPVRTKSASTKRCSTGNTKSANHASSR